MLCVSAILGFFLGIFDLTLYTSITANFGTDAGTVLLATILASIPSLAGYLAAKEGPLRKWGTLKEFDKLVFGDVAWIFFSVFFFALAAMNLLGQGLDLLGISVVVIMQLVLGVLLLSHLLLRRKVSETVTIAYA